MSGLRRRILDLLGVPKREDWLTKREMAEGIRDARQQVRGPIGKLILWSAAIAIAGLLWGPSRFLSSVREVYDWSPVAGIATVAFIVGVATLFVVGIAVGIVAPIGHWILGHILGYTIIAPRSQHDQETGLTKRDPR